MAVILDLILLGLAYNLATAIATPTPPAKNVSDCTCGFYDPVTQNLFTESAIVYFNETNDLPSEVFVPQSYEHGNEKGWNTLYRQAAKVTNVRVGKDVTDGASNTSLELYVDPATPAHLVVGGGVRTARQDLFYGSFRMLLRSPGAETGSSLSMALTWNDTQSITTNVQSTDWPWTAWVSTLSGDEFPDRSLGVNYSSLGSNGVSPWDYTEYRVDWSPKEVNWTVGGEIYRSLRKTSDNHFPQTPAPLVLEHWSVGNWFSMQGPPVNRSVANVGWVRLFFNSSLATDEDRAAFSLRCPLSDACAMDDTTLRGASPYNSASTSKWRQIEKPRGNKEVATIIVIICGSVSVLLITNALARRLPWGKLRKSLPGANVPSEETHTSPYAPSVGLTSDEANFAPTPMVSRPASYNGYAASTASSTPRALSRPPYHDGISIYLNAISQEEDVAREKKKSARLSWREYSSGYREAQPYTHDTQPYTPYSQTRSPTSSIMGDEILSVPNQAGLSGPTKGSAIGNDKSSQPVVTVDQLPLTPGVGIHSGYQPTLRPASASGDADINEKTSWAKMKALNSARAQALTPANMLSKKQRVDHLAGLVAVSCLLVTGIHFCLTFVPAAINPDAYVHYHSEVWARKTVDNYLLNLIWIGPFLMISTRFLVAGYLKTGDMAKIAEKAVGRPFRLLIPVSAIAMLEYFLMDSGATEWLEYLPSITWSSWPFTTVPQNFGNFLSEILELAYLIPNAAPQITFNYCTGVLFTIPIQLQGTWVALLAVIVVREIKTPWKRFGFYAFCIVNHWYALSWGSYFYIALMLTDLDLTYKYRKWLKTHPFIYYPILLLCALMAFGALSIDMTTQWTGVNYVGNEYGLHPDIPTGKPIGVTGAAGYPQYYVPKAHGVIFASGIYAFVELSALVQKIFSGRVLIWIFPHIFTIYLIHGFIFWSIGSAICVSLAGRGVQYYGNLLIVAACCYATLFASLPFLTPIVETLGKNVTAVVWQFANQNPAPRRPTLYPFPENFLFVRNETETEDKATGKEQSESVSTQKPRGAFRRYLASIVNAVYPPRGSRHQNQTALNALTRSVSHSGSTVGRPSTPRNVGWRMGRLSGNVEVLRRNNSSAKNNKSKAKSKVPRIETRPTQTQIETENERAGPETVVTWVLRDE